MRKLFKKFENSGSWSAYSEQDTATKWIKPLLGFLGWDIYEINEVREGVLLNLSSGKQQFFDCVLYRQIDFGIIEPSIVLELKKLRSGWLRKHTNSVKKLINNAKETTAKYAVLTRFFETIIYDAKTGEEKAYFRGTNDYLRNFETLRTYLSKHDKGVNTCKFMHLVRACRTAAGLSGRSTSTKNLVGLSPFGEDREGVQ